MNPEHVYAGFVFLLSIGLGSIFAAHAAYRFSPPSTHGRASLIGLTIALLPAVPLAFYLESPWSTVALCSFGAWVCLLAIVLGRLNETVFAAAPVTGPVTVLAVFIAATVVGFALGIVRSADTHEVMLMESAVAAPFVWLVGFIASSVATSWKRTMAEAESTRFLRNH